jgi:hypothetical protein
MKYSQNDYVRSNWNSSRNPCPSRFIKKNLTRCNNVSNFYYSLFIWSSTCFGLHTAHHQEPKTALAASGFLYVESSWTCSWWTLSGSILVSVLNFSRTEIVLVEVPGLLSDKPVNNRLNHETTRKKMLLTNHLGEYTVWQLRRLQCDKGFHYYISQFGRIKWTRKSHFKFPVPVCNGQLFVQKFIWVYISLTLYRCVIDRGATEGFF